MIQEEFTDTLTESYSPTDTVVTLLKNVQSRVTDNSTAAVEDAQPTDTVPASQRLKTKSESEPTVKHHRR